MNKRSIALLLALLLLATLCACGRKSESQAEAAETAAEAPTTVETLETAEATDETVAAPAEDTATPQPTPNWVENDDGSLSATITTEDGSNIGLSLGVIDKADFEGAAEDSTAAPTTPEPTDAPTAPADAPVDMTDWFFPGTDTTLAEYEAMSAEEQLLFYYSFATADEFYEWYNAALAEQTANSGNILVPLP